MSETNTESGEGSPSLSTFMMNSQAQKIKDLETELTAEKARSKELLEIARELSNQIVALATQRDEAIRIANNLEILAWSGGGDKIMAAIKDLNKLKEGIK